MIHAKPADDELQVLSLYSGNGYNEIFFIDELNARFGKKCKKLYMMDNILDNFDDCMRKCSNIVPHIDCINSFEYLLQKTNLPDFKIDYMLLIHSLDTGVISVIELYDNNLRLQIYTNILEKSRDICVITILDKAIHLSMITDKIKKIYESRNTFMDSNRPNLSIIADSTRFPLLKFFSMLDKYKKERSEIVLTKDGLKIQMKIQMKINELELKDNNTIQEELKVYKKSLAVLGRKIEDSVTFIPGLYQAGRVVSDKIENLENMLKMLENNKKLNKYIDYINTINLLLDDIPQINWYLDNSSEISKYILYINEQLLDKAARVDTSAIYII